MSDKINRHFRVTFAGNPTLLELTMELNHAEKLYGQYTEVEIEVDEGDGSVSFFFDWAS